MNRAAAGVVIVALVAAFFFCAPVAFWYNAGGGPIMAGHAPPYRPVYRSLGCAYLGFGDVYAPSSGGLRLGCSGPIVPL